MLSGSRLKEAAPSSPRTPFGANFRVADNPVGGLPLRNVGSDLGAGTNSATDVSVKVSAFQVSNR